MSTALWAPLAAFLITALAIGLLRPLAMRIGLTDKPGQRKQHQGEVPLVGGLACFIGASVALFVGVLLGFPAASNEVLLAWFAASFLLVAVGACDDLTGLSPMVRFAAEIAAVLIMIYGGNVVLNNLGWITPGERLVSLGALAMPFTVFAAVGIINAFNMCDGLDGLSGNLALVTLLALGIADGIWGAGSHVALINVISGAIAGFLLFNQRMHWRSKAMVFLGDAGSMMLGLMLAWSAIEMSQGAERALSPAATLWFLMIPVYDTVRVMLRRMVRGRSPFAADNFHLHHLLIRCGLSVSEAIAVICTLAALGAGIGLLTHGLGSNEFAIAAAFTAGGLLYYAVIENAWHSGRFLGKALAPP